MLYSIRERIDKCLLRGERGVSSIEYVGLAMVAVAILGATIAGLNGGASIGDAFGGQIGSLISAWGGDGGGAGSGVSAGGSTGQVLGISDTPSGNDWGSDSDQRMPELYPVRTSDDVLALAVDMLRNTKSGADLAEFIEQSGVTVKFGPLPNDTYGSYGLLKTITISDQCGNEAPEVLAGMIAHEAQHFRNVRPYSARYENSPFEVLDLLVGAGLKIYRGSVRDFVPSFEEYQSYKVEAEVYRELGAKSEHASRLISIVFDDDGNYRDEDFVKDVIDQNYPSLPNTLKSLANAIF